MGNKITVVGRKEKDFFNFSENGVQVRPARLIPPIKFGDENALTSIFLSALKLIKEFRKSIFKTVNLSNSKNIYYFTEVVFPNYEDSRVDGLIVVVSGGKIVDAAILEMKKGSENLKKEQIERYVSLAKDLKIPRIITVSNEFVSEPTQTPILDLKKPPKSVNLYHLSWSYILTQAHILLFDNDTNIEDEDQVEIMKEVVYYLETKNSGVIGFTQMKLGWKDFVEKINKGNKLKKDDPSVIDTVTSWQQEEKDMALILSRKLGVPVKVNEKNKGNLKQRIDNDIKKLLDEKQLISKLEIKYSDFQIFVRPVFDKRIIEMFVEMKSIPKNDSSITKITWIMKQLKKGYKNDEKLFNEISKELFIEIHIKGKRGERIPFKELEDAKVTFKKEEINRFSIIMVKDLGKNFASRSKIIEINEQMLLAFYRGVVQYLKNWEQPNPQYNSDNDSVKTENK